MGDESSFQGCSITGPHSYTITNTPKCIKTDIGIEIIGRCLIIPGYKKVTGIGRQLTGKSIQMPLSYRRSGKIEDRMVGHQRVYDPLPTAGKVVYIRTATGDNPNLERLH
jgi:hypothetical protein